MVFMRPITSHTDHLVAICSSLQVLPRFPFFFRVFKSVLYIVQSLSRRILDNAISIPEQRSSQYKIPSHRVTPVWEAPNALQVNVLKGLNFPRLISCSFALLLSTSTSGNISLHVYSGICPGFKPIPMILQTT